MAEGYVGIVDIELHFPECRSLKAKRKQLLPAKARLERLGGSVAEIGHHDLWQRSRLALTLVRRRQLDVEETIEEARRYLSSQDFELVRTEVRLFSMDEVME